MSLRAGTLRTMETTRDPDHDPAPDAVARALEALAAADPVDAPGAAEAVADALQQELDEG